MLINEPQLILEKSNAKSDFNAPTTFLATPAIFLATAIAALTFCATPATFPIAP